VLNKGEVTSGKKRGIIYLTLAGKPIIYFWFDATSSGGMALGPRIQGSDVHLTLWEEKGKFRYHVKHKGIEEPPDGYPISGQRSTKHVLDKISKMISKRIRRYQPNNTCWVFTPERWQRIKSLLPTTDLEGNVYLPMELFSAEMDMDFRKKEFWRKVRVQDLLSIEPYFGFREMKEGLRIVRPLSQDAMMVWPPSKVDEIPQFMLDVLGFDEFFNYLEEVHEGKELLLQFKENVQKLRRQ